MSISEEEHGGYPLQGQFDPEDLKRRGLVFQGRHLPYNPELTLRARELRKNMTPAERKLWNGFLRTFPHRVLAQHPIDHYIVDFYCPFLRLVIEIDGEQHYTEAGKTYDAGRDGILSAYSLTVVQNNKPGSDALFPWGMQKDRVLSCET